MSDKVTDNIVTMSVGQAIKRAREAAGLSQNNLAHMCNMDKTSIYFYEKGMRTPSVKVLMRLSKALDCPVSDLLPN